MSSDEKKDKMEVEKEKGDELGMNEDWSESSSSSSSSNGDGNVRVMRDGDDEDDDEDPEFPLHDLVELGLKQEVEEFIREYFESAKYKARRQALIEMSNLDKEALEAQLVEFDGEYRDKLFEELDDEGCSPLHVAILFRQLECMKVLIQAGASGKAKCNLIPVLHMILGVGSVPQHKEFAVNALKFVLGSFKPTDKILNFKAIDDLQRTVVHLIAEFDLPECFEILIKYWKSNPQDDIVWLKCDMQRRTFLHIACAAKSKKVLDMALNLDNKEIVGKLLDRVDMYEMTPLHVAAANNFSSGVKLLLKARKSMADVKDARGRTAKDWAKENGCQKTYALLGGEAGEKSSKTKKSGNKTLLVTHEVCQKHYTCKPSYTSRRCMADVPPENVNRLKVLLDADLGILRCGRLDGKLEWAEATKAELADVLRVHDFTYVNKIRAFASQLGENDLGELDGDTTISGLSFEAALFAAGSVCDAIDSVMRGDHRNAFCAVRPPGHHSGPRGVVTSRLDPNGSYGFCLLSNCAIGGAYARNMYRHQGVKKIAIIDFDVHHGNGTEACVKNLVPTTVQSKFESPFCQMMVSHPSYKPWLNEQDAENVFFASIHGFGKRIPGLDPDPRAPPHIGYFYPADGENFGFNGFQLPGPGEPKILDVGQNSKSRMEWRSSWRKHVLPALNAFEPDLIIISAGFDAHRLDDINMGYISAVEHDYYWLTKELVKIANKHAKGRVVSVLEGGYKIQGRIVSPFARSVAYHVAALVETSENEIYDANDAQWEENHEKMLIERAKQKQEEQRLAALAAAQQDQTAQEDDDNIVLDSQDEPSRKRSKRSHQPVDYVALNEKLSKELQEKRKEKKEPEAKP